MRATVEKEGCIACEICVNTAPEVFRMGEDGKAEAYIDPLPEELITLAQKAADGCPVSVISVL